MSEWIFTSSVLIILILVIRGVFRKKLGMRARYALWLIVVVRLLVPVSFAESNLSILNLLPEDVYEENVSANETKEENSLGEQIHNTNTEQSTSEFDHGGNDKNDGVEGEPDISSGNVANPQSGFSGTTLPDFEENGQSNFNQVASGEVGSDETVLSGTASLPLDEKDVHISEVGESLSETGTWLMSLVFRYVWAVGALVWAFVLLSVNIVFVRKVCGDREIFASPMESKLPVYISNEVKTPCMFGLLHPAIYLTSQAVENEESLKYILCHENTHYRHRDNWWVLIRNICFCLHWYNPLVWLAVYLSRQDCELACDEETIERLGETERIAYGRVLLAFCVQNGQFFDGFKLATTMSGSKEQLKERLQMIVKHPRRYVWAFVSVVLLSTLVTLITFTGSAEDVGQNLPDSIMMEGDENGEIAGESEDDDSVSNVPEDNNPTIGGQEDSKNSGEDLEQKGSEQKDSEHTQPTLFGYMGYTGYLDECTKWAGYQTFADKDYDGDGLTDRIWREDIEDTGFWDLVTYRIEFGNGDTILMERTGDGIPGVQTGDLDGDGQPEIMLSMSYGYSTDPTASGELAIYQKGENGYELMKLPGEIADYESDGNGGVLPAYEPTLTFQIEKVEELKAHITGTDFYEQDGTGTQKQPLLDVVVSFDTDTWEEVNFYYNNEINQGKEHKCTVYKGEIVEGAHPCLKLYASLLGKWCLDEVVVTLIWENGAFWVKDMQYMKHGSMSVYTEDIYAKLGDGNQYMMQIGSESDVKTNLYEISYMHFYKVEDNAAIGIQTIDLEEATAQVWGNPMEVTSYAADANIFFEDLNFDGYQDFGIQGWTANRNIPYYIWLWNPVMGRYQYSCWLPNVRVDKEEKLVVSESADGGGIYSTTYYRYDVNNRLYFIRYEEENLAPETIFPKLDLIYCETEYSQPAFVSTDIAEENDNVNWAYWAKQALYEIYQWSGTKVDTVYFTITENGGVYLAQSREDLEEERNFFGRYFSEAARYDGVIESMNIAYVGEVAYSPVVQYFKPENTESMTDSDVVRWYFERSAYGENEKVESIEKRYVDTFVIKTESGKYFELTLDTTTRVVGSVYGPYPEYPMH